MNKKVLYDEIEIEDMEYIKETGMFYYPCPCGDKFRFHKDLLIKTQMNEIIAECPSCNLTIKVIYEDVDLVSIMGI